MARRRTLRPDEQDLWQAVARTVRGMHAAPVSGRDAETSPPLILPPSVRPSAPPVHPFRVGEKADKLRAHDLSPTLSQTLAAQPLRMDAKTFGKMTRGKLEPQSRIDLHGMTLSEAHPELIRFVLNAHAAGLRLVLVITGKGKRGVDTGPIPQRQGALRHQVPHWLRLPPLGPAVLQISEANIRHGGSGAYYVYLRRGA